MGTEVSTFEAFDPSITIWLIRAQKINDSMTIANTNASCYWWLIDGNDANEGVIGPNGQGTKRLYVIGNYSKFVRSGYYRIGMTITPVSWVSVSAYKDLSTGKFVSVAINYHAVAETLNFTTKRPASWVAPRVASASLNLAQQPSITVGGGRAFVATCQLLASPTLLDHSGK